MQNEFKNEKEINVVDSIISESRKTKKVNYNNLSESMMCKIMNAMWKHLLHFHNLRNATFMENIDFLMYFLFK